MMTMHATRTDLLYHVDVDQFLIQKVKSNSPAAVNEKSVDIYAV